MCCCVLLMACQGLSAEDSPGLKVPSSGKVAVSLSYDDALDSQLNIAVPALNKRGLKASFYPFPNAPKFQQRLPEWKVLASQGHELGNHTLFHSCKRSKAGSWVQDYQNLDNHRVADMVRNIKIANTVLQAVDGKTERTFTPACGHTLASDGDYLPEVLDLFVGVKYIGVKDPYGVILLPDGHSAKEMIAFIENAPADAKVINILFHGVGGDYLSVSKEEHEKLLDYLVANSDRYWVDTFIAIMKNVTESK